MIFPYCVMAPILCDGSHIVIIYMSSLFLYCDCSCIVIAPIFWLWLCVIILILWWFYTAIASVSLFCSTAVLSTASNMYFWPFNVSQGHCTEWKVLLSVCPFWTSEVASYQPCVNNGETTGTTGTGATKPLPVSVVVCLSVWSVEAWRNLVLTGFRMGWRGPHQHSVLAACCLSHTNSLFVEHSRTYSAHTV